MGPSTNKTKSRKAPTKLPITSNIEKLFGEHVKIFLIAFLLLLFLIPLIISLFYYPKFADKIITALLIILSGLAGVFYGESTNK